MDSFAQLQEYLLRSEQGEDFITGSWLRLMALSHKIQHFEAPNSLL